MATAVAALPNITLESRRQPSPAIRKRPACNRTMPALDTAATLPWRALKQSGQAPPAGRRRGRSRSSENRQEKAGQKRLPASYRIPEGSVTPALHSYCAVGADGTADAYGCSQALAAPAAFTARMV